MPFGLARQGPVDVADAGDVPMFVVTAGLIDVGALSGTVEIRQARVVELQGGAAD